MTNLPMTELNKWQHATTEIPDSGLEVRRLLDEEQSGELAAALGVLAVEKFEARYRLRPRPAGCFMLTGEVSARITQECVVTLEPVASSITEPLHIEFRPAAAMPQPTEAEREALSVEEVEPIEQHKLMVGRIILETLAAAIDPFPRAPGAQFIWTDAAADKAAAAADDGPFAALAQLKPKPKPKPKPE